MNRLDVLFVVRRLGIGGSERQLILLARALAARGRRVGIAVFYGGGILEATLGYEGVELIDLRKGSRWQLFGFMRRFRDLLRARRPRVVHGYLPVPNLLALFTRQWLPGARVVWGVRDSGMEAASYDLLTRLTFRATRALSRYADLVIANSEAGRRRHLALGYPADRLRVVNNGIDTVRFCLPEGDRRDVRVSLGLPVDVPLVGCVARHDRVKGVDTLINGFALARKQGWRGQLVIVGDGDTAVGAEWLQLAADAGVIEQVKWQESEPALPAWYGAVDALCLPSRSEGFSNVLAEVMSCGTLCLASDVGDAAEILDGTGQLFPAGDAAAVARELMTVDGRHAVEDRHARRDRIVSRYRIEKLATTTDALLFPMDP